MKCFQFPTNILNCAIVHCHLLGPSCISKHLLQPLEQRSTFPKSQKASVRQIIPQHKTQKGIKKNASVCNHYPLNFRKIFLRIFQKEFYFYFISNLSPEMQTHAFTPHMNTVLILGLLRMPFQWCCLQINLDILHQLSITVIQISFYEYVNILKYF